MKVLLGKNAAVLQAAGCTASIEAGRDDRQRHFDHHGQFEKNTCPCNDETIPWIRGMDTPEEVVGTTHLDADTFVGVTRLLHYAWIRLAHEAGLNFMEMALHDVKSSERPRGLTPTKCFMLGLSSLERTNCPAEGVVDVTAFYERVWCMSVQTLIEAGRKVNEQAEAVVMERLLLMACGKTTAAIVKPAMRSRGSHAAR